MSPVVSRQVRRPGALHAALVAGLSILLLATALPPSLRAADPAPEASRAPSTPAPQPTASEAAFPAGEPSAVTADASAILPYGSSGYRYKIVNYGDLPGFEQSGFDDVAGGFSDGTAGFGSYCSPPWSTNWSGLNDILLRKQLTLPAGATSVTVWVAIDNDVQVFWNGTDISGGLVSHEGCASYDALSFTVPANVLLSGDNLLAARGRNRDSGSPQFIDLKVTAVVPGGVPAEPSTDATEKLENGSTGGDPVQTFSGAFLYSRVDVAIAGRGPTPSFARSYSSADTRTGPLGPGWTYTYGVRLRSPGDASADLLFVGPDGNTDRFTANPDGSFSPPPAVYRTLVRNADGTFTVTEKSLTHWTFNAAGSLTAITDRYGNTSTLGYNGAGELVSVADPAGRGSLTLAYTAGRLTSVTDWASPARTVAYAYDAAGRLATVTDRTGALTTFAYDGTTSRLTTITDARGNVALTLTYDAAGRVATQKDARGLLTGATTTFAYVVNPDGTRVTTVSAPPTSFEPSFSPTIVDTYNPQGWLTQAVARPSSTETLTETYTYDAIGNRTQVTDPRGNTTDFCYDLTAAGTVIAGSRGNLTRRIDPAPTPGAARPVTLITYDGFDNPIGTVSPRGVVSSATTTCATDLSGAINPQYATDLAYDPVGARLLSTTSRFTDPEAGAQTAVTRYEYADPANPGSVTRLIPPRGNTGPTPDYTYAVTSTYFGPGSQAGMLASVADALGNTTTYAYDPVGRLTSSVDPLGNVVGGIPAVHRTDLVYDTEDRVRFVRLPASVAGGAQLVTETRYDEVGNPIVRIDPAGQVTTSAYDERDGLFQVTESPAVWTDPALPPSGVIATEYAYDAGGNLVRMTRAKGDAAAERVTEYAYDGRGLVRAETQYPAWPSTSPTLVATSAYDPVGNLTVATDQLDRTTTYAYDALNRLVSIDYSDPAMPDVTYGYDPNGNRTSMTDGTGATTYAYDALDRLVSVTSPGPATVGYRYDLDGNRTKLIYPDATAVTYTFDKASRMSGLVDWASRTTGYTYFPDGALQTASNPNGTVATYAYDNARRATGISNTVATTTLTSHAYTLDGVGNVTGLDEFVSGITQGPTGWSSSARVNADDGFDQIDPALAIGADDTAYAAWMHGWFGPEADIYASQRNPSSGTWAAQQRVNNVTAGDQFEPDIAVDGSGNAYAVWTDASVADRNIFFSKRPASTGTWSNSVRVNDDPTSKTPDQRFPAIAARNTGEAIAVWLDKRGNKENIYSARLAAGSSTWSTNLKVTTNTNTTKGVPDVALGPDGTAYAVWYAPASGNADIWFATLAPGSSTWSANAKISDDPGTAYQNAPQIGVDGAGNITVIWSDWRVEPGQLRARHRVAGSSTWSPSVVIANDGANEPSLSVRSDGRAVVAWHDGVNSSTATLWASEYEPTAGTWSSPQRISDPSATDSDPTAAAAIGTSGTVVVWTNRHDLAGGGQDFDIAAKTKSFSGGGSDTFTYNYDRLDRLTGVTGPDGAATYTYDPAGNRLSMVGGGTTAYAYDRADRITSAGAAAITVNANGNTIARGPDTFTYDQANRLKTATVAGISETYAYDGDGVRFSRQVGTGPAVQYVTDVNSGLPVTLDDGVRKYVWGQGLAYAVSGTGIEVYHTDRLGSVRAITDATGAVTATYRTDEFGISTASAGTSSQPFAFTGEPRDATGLTYLRARYYDPSLGRFLSRDPWPGSLAVPQTLDPYVYVGNNPATYADPSGKCIGPLIVVCIGVAAGVVGYVGGTVLTNVVTGQSDDPLRGANPVDLTISAVAGGLSGGVGGLVEGTAGRVALNAIIGFDASAASMAVGGRRNALELVLGSALGGVGGAINLGELQGGVQGLARSLVGNGGTNALLTMIQNVVTQLFGPAGKSRVLSGAGAK